jgi:hypothetical protein
VQELDLAHVLSLLSAKVNDAVATCEVHTGGRGLKGATAVFNKKAHNFLHKKMSRNKTMNAAK